MKLNCPHCKQEYEISTDCIDKTFRCTTCNNEFIVQNPNLISCPECFEKVSKRATVCPHCGAPLKTQAVASTATQETEPEQEVFSAHPSAMYYLLGIILGILLTPFIVGIFILIPYIIDINCTVYRVTTRRVLVNTGFFNKKQVEIWIKDMRSVNLQRDFWQLIIGTGSVAIGTAATAGTEIKMNGLRNAQQVVDIINGLRK